MITEQVGTGRRHGERPSEAGPELTLYLATHGATAWTDPQPWDVAPLIEWYRTLPGCSNGGSLHIIIEDNNCDDHHVDWCRGYADGQGDTCGSELAGLLGRMDAYNRVHAVDRADGYVLAVAPGGNQEREAIAADLERTARNYEASGMTATDWLTVGHAFRQKADLIRRGTLARRFE